jgi:hypothetical protein
MWDEYFGDHAVTISESFWIIIHFRSIFILFYLFVLHPFNIFVYLYLDFFLHSFNVLFLLSIFILL